MDIHNEEQLDKLFTYFLIPCDKKEELSIPPPDIGDGKALVQSV